MSIVVQHRRDSNANVEANTPAAGEIWFDTTKKEMSIGDGSTAAGIRLQKKNTRETLTPAQITSNQNDYSPSGLKHAAALRLSTDASRNITGLVPVGAIDTTDGRAIVVYNGGSFNVVLQDQNASSSAANRFDLGGADITLAPKQSLSLRYSNTISRWEVSDNNFGQAISDGVVSARKLAASALGARVGMINGTIAESHAGSAATFALKTLAGTDPSATDPVYFVFQNGTGGFVVRTVTAALSITISSGSSMGASNSVPFKLHIVGIDNAGTVALGVVNCVSGTDVLVLHEGLPFSTVAEGGAGAADSTQTVYSASALSSKFICLAGYAAYDSGLASAGAWVATPTWLGLHGPGVPRPGDMVKVFAFETSAFASGTTTIPFDDTIPQNTEGDQYLSLACSPRFASHILDVNVDLAINSSTANNMIAALFQDSAANALAAKSQVITVGDLSQLLLSKRLLAGVGPTTLKVRAGGGAGGTFAINGLGGARKLGGVEASYIRAAEIAS